MSFQYERDDSRRRVVVAFRGPFQLEEALACIERHHKEDVWTYGALYDLRLMTGYPDMSTLRRLLSEDIAGTTGERGPVAIVTTDPDTYRAACAYSAMAKSKLRVEAFREIEDADEWLTKNTDAPR